MRKNGVPTNSSASKQNSSASKQKSRSKSPKSRSKRDRRNDMTELRNLGSPSSNQMPNMYMNSMYTGVGENTSPGEFSQFSQNGNFVGSPLSQSQLSQSQFTQMTDAPNDKSQIKYKIESFTEVRLITCLIHILGIAAIFIGFVGVVNDYSEGILKSFNFFHYEIKSSDPNVVSGEAYYGFRALVEKTESSWVLQRFDDMDDDVVATCARDEDLTVSLYMIGTFLYFLSALLSVTRVFSHATISMAMINFCTTMMATSCIGASFYIFIQGCFYSSSVDDPNGVLSSTKELQLCSMCTIAGAAAAFMSTCFLAYEFSYADSEGLNNKEYS